MSEGAPAARPRLLLVDDEADFLEMLACALANRGFDVVAVGGGRPALTAARAQSFDLAITDFKMPDVDGVAMVRELRQIDPRLPVIVASGYVSAAQWAVLAQTGACAFLQKPFSLEDLADAMARHL
jgi:DNA-binding NtrC family response regulator